MARKRTNVKKIREIIRFKETTDMSERKIARALNISRPVVAQCIRDFAATGHDLPRYQRDGRQPVPRPV